MVPSLGIIMLLSDRLYHRRKDERDPTSATQQLPLLSLRIRVLNTQILAYMLDSLVRVSRRVDENHFVSITTHATTRLNLYPRMAKTQNFSVP